MSSLSIKSVETNKDRLAFIKMPWKVYEKDQHWVPPLIADQKEFLDPKRGLFFRNGDARLWVAYRGNEPVGRISAQVNHRHDKLYADGKGFFGFFECEDNQETANALFCTAEEYLKVNQRRLVEGPFNFSIYDEIGVLVDGFDTDPYVLNMHNPPFYQKLIEAAGYAKSIDWYAYRVQSKQVDRVPERLLRLRDRLAKKREVTVRPMEMAHFARDAAIVKCIFSAAWDRNWGHVPMTDPEFERVAKALKQLIIPELSFIAEVNGKPVGFALSIYDANVAAKKINGRLYPFGFIKLLSQLKKTDRFRLILMGVLEEHRNRGYEVIFYTHVIEKGLEMGFKEAECSLIVEDNEAMIKSMSHLASDRYKTYRIFKKAL